MPVGSRCDWQDVKAVLMGGVRALRAQVTMEDYPEAGMSALKYYTIQSYTK